MDCNEMYFSVSETFGPKHRTWGGIVFSIYYSAGFTTLAGIAFLIRDYKKLQIACTAPNLVGVLIYW